jgi:hypothetical protein
MRAHITFKSGAKIVVDVEELTTERSGLTNELTRLNWVTPNGWTNKLHSITLSEIVAVVMERETWNSQTASARLAQWGGEPPETAPAGEEPQQEADSTP